MLTRAAGTTLTEQLAQRFAERIHARLLAPGARLPSVRDCAQRHGVSPHTVVAAYDQLLAQGLIEARRQRGFFVRAQPAPLARSPLGEAGEGGPRLAAPVDATALIRSMFQAPGSRAAPGSGTLPADWLDLPLLAGALRRVAQADRLASHALHYGDPAGDERLRHALVPRLADVGVQAEPQQIVTTLGATQALDIVSRALLAPGDAVLVDDPGWAVEFARLARLGMRILPVPRGAGGVDFTAMQQLVAEHRPRLYVTTSVLHNPTGHSLTLGQAHRLLTLAQAQDFHIVEDDTYAWLAVPHAPRMAALDGLQRTIYISGFSKILAPAWRVGYVAAPKALVARIVDVKLLTSLTTPAITEQAVAACLEQGALRRHAERVRARLATASSRCLALATEHGCTPATPAHGLFAWIETHTDTDRLAQLLLDDGWLTAPGSLFHASHRPSGLMRVNVATSLDPAFWRALATRRAELSQRPNLRVAPEPEAPAIPGSA
ncbi:MAG TPA: PLP-dependent aminotransferase family protein [Methylibium sp.]|uniref:aminotransferase-like domain-containing protein n=1 Tax=Methylibium sp. TaxID=2067992 RepID=UPI002DBA326B|nr:PLP-dependent aminotransferase family protein [Methylibium sp.]HEU4458992.1 PLP-dependent aminotransferase family protein [Methylibium sp.]